MKKYNIILVFLVALLAFTSCEKLLEIKDDSIVTIAEGIQTADDLEAVLNGAYDIFRNNHVMGGTSKVASDVLADEVYASSTGFEWGQIKTLNMNLFNPIGRDIWRQSYICINRANVVINYLDNDLVSVPPAEKALWKAEARYIRAVCHYHLVQYFGLPYDETKTNSQPGVPLRIEAVLTNEFAATQVPRSSVEEIYNFVISEMLAIEDQLPAIPGSAGRVGKNAATGFLAKVYFRKNDMAKAFEYSNKVVITGTYILDTDWKAKFAHASLGDATTEQVFHLVSSAISDNSGSGFTDAYRTDKNDPPGFGPTEKLRSQLQEVATDARGTQIVLKAGANNIPGVYSTKFNYEYMDAPVVSYNEVLLIRAEAGLAVGQGTPDADLNAVQTRAGVPTTSATAVSIQKERRKELALEGNYFFELKRIKSSNIRGENWDSKKLIFQIPDIEQNGNPNIVLN